MHFEYRWAVEQAETDPNVNVIVVTGAGRGFCAGADTSALEGHAARGAYDDGVADDVATPGFGVRPEFDHPFAFHFGLTKPVIAKINGPAAGVGLVLACYCDMRFVADDAKLTTSASRLGLPAEYGLSWVLPRLVGIGNATDLMLSSRVIRGPEAERIGLVNRSLPADELDAHVDAYARALATEISPAAMAQNKRQIYGDLHGDVGSSVANSERLFDQMMGEADYREGVSAWIDKRPPAFLGLPRSDTHATG